MPVQSTLILEALSPALGNYYDTLQLSLLTDAELRQKGKKLEASLRQLDKDERMLGKNTIQRVQHPLIHSETASHICAPTS